jgi:hypothetical protein
MTPLPTVVRAEYRGGFRIRLTFNDDSEGTVDFGSWLEGPVFEPLKNPEYFQRFFVDGGTVTWPNGADIAPETLYEGVARGRPDGTELRTARRKRTQAASSRKRTVRLNR